MLNAKFLAAAALVFAACGPMDETPSAESETDAPAVATTEEALTPAQPTLYSGVYRGGSGGYVLLAGLDQATFLSKVSELDDSGQRLVDINIHKDDDDVTRFDGVWRAGSGNQIFRYNLTFSGLASATTTYEAQGLRLQNVETYVVGAETRFAAVYRAGSGAQGLHASSWSSFVADWSSKSSAGLRLVDIESYVLNGTRQFVGVYRPGSDGYALYAGATKAAFLANVAQAKAQGLRLVDLDIYWENNAWRYTGVYRAGADLQELVLDDTWAGFVDKWSTFSAGGMRLIGLRTSQAPSWSHELGRVYEGKAVGYSYAVVEGGSVVASGGVGYSRAPWEANSPSVAMTSSTRVHLASVSKSITAVAMMDVTERYANVNVDQPFYPYVKSRFPTKAAGVENVTIRQLLTHKSGMSAWGYCGDNFSLSMAQLIATPLAGTPGVTSQYSNGNFCLVRTVIEAISGMSYVDYVKTYVLAPMGITTMSCVPSSALYYKQGSFGPGYFWSNDYSSQCAAYGWYASAQDLAKFLIGVRNNTVLGGWTTLVMNAGLLGWWNLDTASGDAYHHNGAWVTGDGRGCNTGIIRLPNGVEAVILSNTDGFDTIGSMGTAYRHGPYSD